MRLNRLRRDAPSSDFQLLKQGTVAPVGNLRIAESLPPNLARRVASRKAVTEREHDFIAWAAEHGAQVGGTAGAGGDSPKMLLRKDPDDQVWIDVWQTTGGREPRAAKFARGRRERDRSSSARVRLLPRADEAGHRHHLTDGMELREGQKGPSLWLPRFGVQRHES